MTARLLALANRVLGRWGYEVRPIPPKITLMVTPCVGNDFAEWLRRAMAGLADDDHR